MTQPHKHAILHLASIALLSILPPLLATPAHAFRPFEGTDAQVAPPRALETELQPVGYLRVGSERFLVTPELVLNYGAGSGTEFVLEGKRLVLMNPEGGEPTPLIEDLGLSVKRVLRKGILQHAKGPSIATEGGFLLPTTEEYAGGFNAALIATQEWQAFTLHLNGAVADTRAHNFGRFASLIAEFAPAGWTVHPIAELAIEREGKLPISRSALGGIVWETRPGLTIDAAVRISQSDDHEIELRSGLTWKKHVPNGPKL